MSLLLLLRGDGDGGTPVTTTLSNNTGATTGTLDVEIHEPEGDISLEGRTFFETSNGSPNDRRHTLIRFTGLSGIPSNATITSVTFSAYLFQTGFNVADSNIGLFRLKRMFTSAATWNKYDGTNAWGTAGAIGTTDYDSTVLIAQNYSASSTINQYKDFTSASLISYIQEIVNGTSPNYGFLFCRTDFANPIANGEKLWRSSEGTDGQRPKLTVTYTITGGGGGGTTYTQTLSSSITVDGVYLRKTSRLTSGSTTATGSKTKKISRMLSSTITGVGEVFKKTLRTLTGTLTGSGVHLKKTVLGTLSGAITATSTRVKKISKLTIGDLVSTGVITGRKLTRTLSSVITLDGTYLRKITLSTIFGGSITPSATIFAGTALRYLATGSITLTGTIRKAMFRSLSGAITASGTVVKKIARALSGVITVSGLILRNMFKRLSGSVVLTATISTTSRFFKSLVGSSTPSGTTNNTYYPFVPPEEGLVYRSLTFLRRFIGRR